MAGRRRRVEAAEQQVGQDHDAIMPSSGQARMPETEIEKVDGPNWEDKAKFEQFMNEPVDVFVSEATDPNASPIVEIYVNGVVQRFLRGQQQTVKRKFVEGLARAKPTHVSTHEFTNTDGARDVRIRRNTGLRFPFSVMSDPNPNGPAWLKKVLAEG